MNTDTFLWSKNLVFYNFEFLRNFFHPKKIFFRGFLKKSIDVFNLSLNTRFFQSREKSLINEKGFAQKGCHLIPLSCVIFHPNEHEIKIRGSKKLIYGSE